jgi:hypothetical protein
MNGAIYMLSRNVAGDRGEPFMQNIAVYATSPAEARAIVMDQFARLRRISASPERAYRDAPDFRIDKIPLDQPKLISLGVTT